MLEGEKILTLLKSIVLTGGLVLQTFRGKATNIPKKSDLHPNLVQDSSTAHTIVDNLVQEISLEILHSQMPTVAVNAEENTPRVDFFSNDFTKLCFHVDPLDGTLSYVQGRDDFAIGAAFSDNLEFIASAIYFPAYDRLYSAIRGKGIQLQTSLGHLLRFERIKPLDNMYIQKRTEQYLPVLKHMNLTKYDTMSAHHGMIAVAEGRVRVLLYHMANPHDFGIPQVILEEAGGVCTNNHGQPISYDAKFNRLPYFFAFSDPQTMNDFFKIRDELL